MYRKVLPESTEYQSLPRKVHQHVLAVLATWVSDTASLEPRIWVPASQQGKAIIPLKEKNGAVNNHNFLILLNKLHFYLKNFFAKSIPSVGGFNSEFYQGFKREETNSS